jgi:predicted ester cyclase
MLERDVAAIPYLVFNIDFLVAVPPVIGARLLFDCTPVGELFGLPVNGKRITPRVSRLRVHHVQRRSNTVSDLWKADIKKNRFEAPQVPKK